MPIRTSLRTPAPPRNSCQGLIGPTQHACWGLWLKLSFPHLVQEQLVPWAFGLGFLCHTQPSTQLACGELWPRVSVFCPSSECDSGYATSHKMARFPCLSKAHALLLAYGSCLGFLSCSVNSPQRVAKDCLSNCSRVESNTCYFHK